ncbi:MAG: 2-isopropylmalate synthase [Thermodesulfobacteriota bacterium]
MADKIIILDTTLRDGEQSPGYSMNTAEKLHFAFQLEKLNVDVIEAGFPSSSDGDFESVQAVANKIKTVEVAALARTSKEDIDAAWTAIKRAAQPRIHIFIATSEIHLRHKLNMTRDQVISRVVEAIKYAARFTDNIEFSAEDGSRSDKDFLCRIFEAAISAGAATVNLPDTVGYAVPSELTELISYVKQHTPNIGKAVLSVHCHNDLGLATANTLASISAGARQVEVTVNGIGERAGNTSLEEVVMALHTRRNSFNVFTGVDTKEIYPSSHLLVMTTGIPVQPNKAIVGANAFAHESGIHQDGVLKNRSTYEIIEPATIGLSTSRLVIGKHSGRHAFKERLQELGYKFSDYEIDKLFQRFKELADKRKEIVDDDIEAIVAEEILRVPDIFKLIYLNVVSGTEAVPTATVQLEIDGKTEQDAGFGMGPIDATFNTIAEITGTHSKLLHFSVDSLTGGTDAQGIVTVQLEEDGIRTLGKGNDPDIIVASAKAYINGLNRLEHQRRNSFSEKNARNNTPG